MHPRTASLVAFSDAELYPGRSQRIARHLQDCPKCQAALERISQEKKDFSTLVSGRKPAADVTRGLAAVLAAIAGWRGAPAPELRSRARAQIEVYFGCGAASFMERPDIRADELLAKTLALMAAFLGQDAAEAVAGEILRGLDCAGLTAEVSA
jgi:anti-sigma factor RsiW